MKTFPMTALAAAMFFCFAAKADAQHYVQQTAVYPTPSYTQAPQTAVYLRPSYTQAQATTVYPRPTGSFNFGGNPIIKATRAVNGRVQYPNPKKALNWTKQQFDRIRQPPLPPRYGINPPPTGNQLPGVPNWATNTVRGAQGTVRNFGNKAKSTGQKFSKGIGKLFGK